jgi:hypothetical protein
MNNRKPRKRPTPKIVSVSVSRVYNTGNYTNIKYDLTAQVPKGASAKGTLYELHHIISMLKPVREPDCRSQFDAAVKKPAEEQTNWEKDHLKEWSDMMASYHQRIAARNAALQSLDDLGGAIEKRDAKKNWSYEDDCPF